MALLDTLRRTWDRQDLRRPGRSVLAAVSGGPDSLSLLHALHLLQDELQIRVLHAAHLDHGLRGGESAAEAAFVAAFCATLGVSCRVETLDAGALASGTGVQAAARSARYAFLQRACANLGADTIATAHTRDDQVETVLMNILRGSGLEGLRGIPYSRANIIRPLRDATRAEVEDYCAEHGLDPRRDPSNLDPSHYLRNRVRLELLPDLEAHYAPGVRAALLRLSQNAALDDAYLQAQSEAALLSVRAAASKTQITIRRPTLIALPPALQRRVLRLALTRLRAAAHDIEEHHIARFLDAALDPSTASYSITIPVPESHLILHGDLVLLRLAKITLTAAAPIPLSAPGAITFGEMGWEMTARIASTRPNDGDGETLDADRVDLPTLHVRGWRAGDRMDVLGLEGKSKKLSDLFTDAKIPREQRDSIPIVADANGLLWIVGMRIAERARVTEGTARFLRLTAAPTPLPPSPAKRAPAILGEGESEFFVQEDQGSSS